jgi:hypothetical protein
VSDVSPDPSDPTASSSGAALEPALVAALLALRAYLPHLVLIGGWVPYLHQRYGGHAGWVGNLSLTSEADILVPRALPADARPPLAEALRAAGLAPEGKSNAVWVGDTIRGERIEFLAEHVGMAQDIGRPTSVRGQKGIAALALTRVGILGRHTTMIPLPVPADDVGPTLPVRIPLLGAYLIQKAATVPDRLTTANAAGRQKAAKDLLYIRDVIAAGSVVYARITAEIATMTRADRDAAALKRRAAQNLDLALQGTLRFLLPDAARMRHEREPGVSVDDAELELQGRLRDAFDLLRAKTTRTSRRPPPNTGA